jgi:hypothetical protein
MQRLLHLQVRNEMSDLNKLDIIFYYYYFELLCRIWCQMGIRIHYN